MQNKKINKWLNKCRLNKNKYVTLNFFIKLVVNFNLLNKYSKVIKQLKEKGAIIKTTEIKSIKLKKI